MADILLHIVYLRLDSLFKKISQENFINKLEENILNLDEKELIKFLEDSFEINSN
jgi:hypothetical protein